MTASHNIHFHNCSWFVVFYYLLAISFVLSVRKEQLGSHWTDFHEVSYFSIFLKSAEIFKVSLKSEKNNRYCTWMYLYINDNIALSSPQNEKRYRKKVVEKIKTNIWCSVSFFSRKSCRLWDNVEKYYRAGQATDDNITGRMCFACCIPKATDTHSRYVILVAFPRQKMVSRTRLNVILYLHYMSC